MIQKPTNLKVKDHSVSGEIFELKYNEDLAMFETCPQPSKDHLPGYYQSDDYISHTDSKRNLLEKVYHVVKTMTLKRKLKLINGVSNHSQNLLDVGCGTGDFLQLAMQYGWKVAGIEPNENARQIANAKTHHMVYEDDQLMQFGDKTFDVITLWHVLEHLPNLEDHITIFKRLLKSNGILIIAVPNYKSYDAMYYKEYWAAYDVPRHLWHFSQESIRRLMSKLGLNVIEIIPMKFDSYYVSLLSEKYKTGFMNPIKAFRIGWLSNYKGKTSGEYSSLIYVIKNLVN